VTGAQEKRLLEDTQTPLLVFLSVLFLVARRDGCGYSQGQGVALCQQSQPRPKEKDGKTT
jgi:hypothetical protein